MLSRRLGAKGHYPAIDVMLSISRCMSMVTSKEHRQAATKLKSVMATYDEAEDLINIGAYKRGSNKNIDYAIEKIDAVNDFLCQDVNDKFDFEETEKMLEQLFQ
jgi:flagellum-specific ATP synthase